MSVAVPDLGQGSTIVIVGASLAGLRVAEGARNAGFDGRIVLIGDEEHPPYDRPPLSKSVLLDDDYRKQLSLAPDEQVSALHLEMKLGRPVVGIDREGRRVLIAGGEAVAYDRLVLATGSSVRILPGMEPGHAGVCYLRTLDEALQLRRRLAGARRVLIVGAGVIGLEVAAAASKGGAQVTVVEAGERVMGRAASVPVTEFITRRHLAAGVDIRFGVTVQSLEPVGEGALATLSDGASLAADVVVVGVGVKPNDQIARDAGLEVEGGGIVVDGLGRTSDPAIYAAGEVAVHYNARAGRHDRQETWAHAAAHGAHVGRSIVDPGAEYDELGSYWTDQYDFTLNVVGRPIGDLNVTRGDPASGQFVVLHLVDARVVGASAVNATRELRAAKGLIGLDRTFTQEELADPSTDLRALAKS